MRLAGGAFRGQLSSHWSLMCEGECCQRLMDESLRDGRGLAYPHLLSPALLLITTLRAPTKLNFGTEHEERYRQKNGDLKRHG